jgi:predicted metal-dependent enzyme (double-stranded beta helix superfamily)
VKRAQGQIEESGMSEVDERERAIADSLAEIRTIENADGISEASLEAIKGVLLQLAKKRSLFDERAFPPPDRDGISNFYGLSVDDDDRYALYLSVGRKGRETPPHNHTTWAVIVGMSGEEENRIYARSDDGSIEGEAELKQIDSRILRADDGLAYMPDAIHSIHVISDEPTRHFHMYGTALHALHERVQFDTETGRYTHFPAIPSIPAKADA